MTVVYLEILLIEIILESIHMAWMLISRGDEIRAHLNTVELWYQSITFSIVCMKRKFKVYDTQFIFAVGSRNYNYIMQ